MSVSGSVGQGFDTRRVYPLGARRDGDVQLLIARLNINSMDIVLLVEIRPSDGYVKPSGPLGAYRQE